LAGAGSAYDGPAKKEGERVVNCRHVSATAT